MPNNKPAEATFPPTLTKEELLEVLLNAPNTGIDISYDELLNALYNDHLEKLEQPPFTESLKDSAESGNDRKEINLILDITELRIELLEKMDQLLTLIGYSGIESSKELLEGSNGSNKPRFKTGEALDYFSTNLLMSYPTIGVPTPNKAAIETVMQELVKKTNSEKRPLTPREKSLDNAHITLAIMAQDYADLALKFKSGTTLNVSSLSEYLAMKAPERFRNGDEDGQSAKSIKLRIDKGRKLINL